MNKWLSTNKWLKVGVLLFLLSGLGAGFYSYWNSSPTPKITYREVPVQRGDIAVTILATGTVQPENRLEIKPPIAGRVENVLVKEGQYVSKGQILAWMSSTERAALLDAARAQGDAELKKWEDLYRPTPVVAPINGTIILRSVESGQTFTTTDAILVMSDRLTIKAQVDETDIAKIKLHQQADLVLDAYSSEKVPARVDQIAFEAKTYNSITTYTVDVLPIKTPDFLRSGMTANVMFFVDSKSDVLFVPSETIVTRDGLSMVLVASKLKKPEEREVTTGVSDGKRTEILSGLNEGDIVLAVQMAALGSKNKSSTSVFSPIRSGGGARGH